MLDAQLDHLVMATPDLCKTRRFISGLFGFEPAAGGRHTGYGTENILIRLGPRQYLEIIGPDTKAPTPAIPRPFGIDSLAEPKLLTWAVAVDNLDERVARSRERGYDPGVLVPVNRERSDGTSINWRLYMQIPSPLGYLVPGDGVVPFLIDWGHSPHPADNLPWECELLNVYGIHPETDAVQSMLDALNVSIHVEQGIAAGLVAKINTPNGVIDLR